MKKQKLKKYFVDCKVEIGCACEVMAENEKDAIALIKEEGWGWNEFEIDRAHYEIEADAMEIKNG